MTDLNPLSSVDLSAIEEGIKAASLDQLRGYAQNHYTEVKQDHDTEYVDRNMAAGYQILREPHWNKGTFACSFISLQFISIAPLNSLLPPWVNC